jgi:hypothetical protein
MVADDLSPGLIKTPTKEDIEIQCPWAPSKKKRTFVVRQSSVVKRDLNFYGV